MDVTAADLTLIFAVVWTGVVAILTIFLLGFIVSRLFTSKESSTRANLTKIIKNIYIAQLFSLVMALLSIMVATAPFIINM